MRFRGGLGRSPIGVRCAIGNVYPRLICHELVQYFKVATFPFKDDCTAAHVLRSSATHFSIVIQDYTYLKKGFYSADSEISSQEDRSTFDENYEPSSQSLMSGEMTESEASWRESTMADNEDGVLEDGEVESSNGEVEVNVEATSRGDDR